MEKWERQPGIEIIKQYWNQTTAKVHKFALAPINLIYVFLCLTVLGFQGVGVHNAHDGIGLRSDIKIKVFIMSVVEKNGTRMFRMLASEIIVWFIRVERKGRKPWGADADTLEFVFLGSSVAADGKGSM